MIVIVESVTDLISILPLLVGSIDPALSGIPLSSNPTNNFLSSVTVSQPYASSGLSLIDFFSPIFIFSKAASKPGTASHLPIVTVKNDDLVKFSSNTSLLS
jgi:hypothetical protein